MDVGSNSGGRQNWRIFFGSIVGKVTASFSRDMNIKKSGIEIVTNRDLVMEWWEKNHLNICVIFKNKTLILILIILSD